MNNCFFRGKRNIQYFSYDVSHADFRFRIVTSKGQVYFHLCSLFYPNSIRAPFYFQFTTQNEIRYLGIFQESEGYQNLIG